MRDAKEQELIYNLILKAMSTKGLLKTILQTRSVLEDSGFDRQTIAVSLLKKVVIELSLLESDQETLIHLEDLISVLVSDTDIVPPSKNCIMDSYGEEFYNYYVHYNNYRRMAYTCRELIIEIVRLTKNCNYNIDLPDYVYEEIEYKIKSGKRRLMNV